MNVLVFQSFFSCVQSTFVSWCLFFWGSFFSCNSTLLWIWKCLMNSVNNGQTNAFAFFGFNESLLLSVCELSHQPLHPFHLLTKGCGGCKGCEGVKPGTKDARGANNAKGGEKSVKIAFAPLTPFAPFTPFASLAPFAPTSHLMKLPLPFPTFYSPGLQSYLGQLNFSAIIRLSGTPMPYLN